MSSFRYRRTGEPVFALVLLAGSLFLLWQAWTISGFESITSAGVFPMLAATVMVVTSGMSVVEALRAPPAPADGGFQTRLLPPVLLVFTAAIATYMLLLERLGFVVSSYLFLVAGMRLLGSRRWVLNLGVSALALAGIYVVFRTVFAVVLPSGTWLSGWLR